MCLKTHQQGRETLIAVCDSDILGEKFKEGHLCIEVSQDFFGDDLATCSEVETALKGATMANFVGCKTVEHAISTGLCGKRERPLHRWDSICPDGANVMQASCPKCGMPVEEGLCRQCTLDSTKLITIPDMVEVVICSVCGSRQTKGKWHLPESRPIEELASSAAVDALCFHKEFDRTRDRDQPPKGRSYQISGRNGDHW